ncbi:outer membrane receptor for ferrienterochelin and colicins [Chitinophaga skermanii]|uniref:Outer membrane receptor for ferrienterochelin and colicins n=1 Tax=Chitinophaga skermanii TaxID=331697 RepID=A0A327QJ09_9BACT|nr:TonB-dependent receptor [Chitinophaga skermanii]RAJ01697.1 outer membrane receptor for ferrienterochelin and colicins [Chitinophaga skermanii]
MKQKIIQLFLLALSPVLVHAQAGHIKGKILSDSVPVPYASIGVLGTKIGALSDEQGFFELKNVPIGARELVVSAVGFERFLQKVQVKEGASSVQINIAAVATGLSEVVVSGTLKPVSKMKSPVPVEVYTPLFFRKNPTPSIFDALQNVNGVRPQVNCNVCNTGDIHINGLEGPYTMVMIDGMPIVSALSTVYGLSGIPNSLVERVEIVKGPASTLYGSEAVAGLINIITKDPLQAPIVTADIMATTWREVNADIGVRLKAGKKANALLGVNYFNYQNPIDHNGDGFTDLTQQHRISLFNKWTFARKNNRIANIAARYFYEDRWGGQMNWNRQYRGSSDVYGESIYTNRVEVIGNYQLPSTEKLMFQYSLNYHDQNSVYGDTWFLATQKIAFAQLTWDKEIGRHSLLAGLPFRYTWYDDNTAATMREVNGKDENKPDRTFLPGIFLQDEIALSREHTLLLGMRYDYNSIHGNILTPRIAYKYSPNYKHTFRLNAGTGYRVVSLFTEDHAALTGARDVIIKSDLKPERSWNANFNYVNKLNIGRTFVSLDFSAFYTQFSNKIIPDYTTNYRAIIYDNLDGHAVSQGVSLNVDVSFPFPLKVIAGTTLVDVYQVNKVDGKEVKSQPLLTEKVSATWAITYTFKRMGLSVDYTGNLYGPMKLPLVSDTDPRKPTSPVWSIQNIQLSKKLGKQWEIYGGVKNLLNYTPPKNAIARPHDPFNKLVQFDPQGNVVPTAENPYALTFDPNYVFAPNQGIRGFLGARFTMK